MADEVEPASEGQATTSAEAAAASQPPAAAEPLAEAAGRIRAQLVSHLPGLDAAVDELLAAYLAGGHALLEGVPGIGKTLLARSFAAAIGRGIQRARVPPRADARRPRRQQRLRHRSR